MSKRLKPQVSQEPQDSHHPSGWTIAIVGALITALGGIVAALVSNQDVNVFVDDGGDDQSAIPTRTVTSPKSLAGEAALYVADWTDGAGEWDMPVGWEVIDGMLINDGTGSSWIYAPIAPSITDYAVEAEIRFVKRGMSPCGRFALGARHGDSGGYWGGVGFGIDPSCRDAADLATIWAGRPVPDFRSTDFHSEESEEYAPGSGWHVYRLEVAGNTVRLLIDGDPIVEVNDNLYLTSGKVGLICSYLQISVRNFRVIAL
jgi:hypothetical protein